ncbi:MAG: hypothetical protein OXU63_07675 [Acidobacteriota bacterium]|nr:hypothetical protein [Acidobacteriota bacterium]
MTRIFWEGWAAAIAVVIFVVVGISAGWGWALLTLAVVWSVVALFVSEPRRPAPPPARRSPPPCGGIAEACPVCLAASVALGVMVGDWLSGD